MVEEENIEIVRKDINRLLKDLDPHKVHDPDEGCHVLKEGVETHDRLLEILLKKQKEVEESKCRAYI